MQGRPVVSASHPAVGFVGGEAGTTESTKHYPNHGADEEDTNIGPEDEDTGGSYTRPTSLAAPGSMKRSNRQPAVAPPRSTGLPSPAVLAVGDRSGTVEVDPEADGVEIEGDEDFGALAAPPRARKPADADRGGAWLGAAGVARSGAGTRRAAGEAGGVLGRAREPGR